MKGAFGILAFILALVAIPIPVLGIGIGWLALLFAAIAAWHGERILPITVVTISVINFLFLSPTLWLSALAPVDYNLIEVTIVLVMLPVAVMVLRAILGRS